MSAASRIYWLGFAVALKRCLQLRGYSASVLARLVEAEGRAVRDDTFNAFSRYNGQLLSRASIKPAVSFAREALVDCGLDASIICERTRGQGVALYRLEGADAVKAYVEGWA